MFYLLALFEWNIFFFLSYYYTQKLNFHKCAHPPVIENALQSKRIAGNTGKGNCLLLNSNDLAAVNCFHGNLGYICEKRGKAIFSLLSCSKSETYNVPIYTDRNRGNNLYVQQNCY